MNTNGRKIEVSEFRQATRSGSAVRTVVTVDGVEIRFLERLSKREAIRSALSQIEHHPERFAPRPQIRVRVYDEFGLVAEGAVDGRFTGSGTGSSGTKGGK